MDHRLFAYGSLRAGQRHHNLLSDAVFLGMHTTEPGYTMLDLGPYPGIIAQGETAITGEVYAIPPALLCRLDRLEDCPRTYHRIELPTQFGGAWVYLYRAAHGEEAPVTSGDWLKRR